MKTRKCTICNQQYEPKHKTSKVCSCRCAATYYDTKVTNKGRRSSRVIARMVGMRSMGEVRFTADTMEDGNIPYEYEPDTFEYFVRETRNYTPDFKYKKHKSRHRNPRFFYVEFKGVLTKDDRKKAKLFREAHPDVEFYFVFQKPMNKIYRGSKTTYAKWCDQHAFVWSDKLEEGWFK